MARTEWYVATIQSRNGVEEKIKYPVRILEEWDSREQSRAVRRENRRLTTSEHELARWLNNNFQPGRDVHLVLEYGPEALAALEERAGAMEGAAEDNLFRLGQKALGNFIRRVQRVMGSGGVRYAGCTSDRSERNGELRPARLHHHLIVNWEAAATCRKKWTAGAVLERELYNVKGDFHALAEYMLRQVRNVPGTHRYTVSRGLLPPIRKPPVRVTRGQESRMRVPCGCIELYSSNYERGRPQYMRYLRPTGTLQPPPGLPTAREIRGERGAL